MSNSSLAKTLTALPLLFFLAMPAFAIDGTASTAATSPAAVKKPAIGPARPLIKEKVQARKEVIQLAREKIASRTANLKAKLEKFKDKRKADLAEKINTNLNKINENQTSQMEKHLATMTNILNKLEARVNQAPPDIKDPDQARSAIASAREAIASASSAVSEQAQKDYTITVTSETRVKADAKTQRDKLHQDLTAVRKMVIEAKKAVSNAIRTAKSGAKVNPVNEEASVSGQ